MSNSLTRRLIDRNKKRAKREHRFARQHFQNNEYDLAIEAEETAMLFDELVIKYERLDRQHQLGGPS